MQICTTCGQPKELDAFGFRNKATERRHQKCKTCVAAYGRAHYACNRQEYIARSVRNMRARRRALRERVWQYLAEHACIDCGEDDPVLLEFDHLNPEKKRSEIYWLVQSTYGWESILAEIGQCQVRCANCHRRRRAVQFAWPKLAFTQARVVAEPDTSEPAVVRRERRPGPSRTPLHIQEAICSTSVVVPTGHQLCPLCGVPRPIELFHFRDKAKSRRHSWCGDCFNAYRRDHYRMNRDTYIQRNSRVLRERGRRWMRRLWEYLSVHPCISCHESDPVVLEFDHVDRAAKRQTVGFLARSGYPWATVEAELAKCQVLCANCHRRRTAVQFDWPKLYIREAAATTVF